MSAALGSALEHYPQSSARRPRAKFSTTEPDATKVGLGDVLGKVAGRNTDVVDQNVDAPEVLEGCCCGGANRVDLRHVEPDGRHSRAEPLDHFDKVLRARRTADAKDHIGTGARAGPTDAAVRARHKRDLAARPKSGAPPVMDFMVSIPSC
ncbi:hypothetical protein M8523_09170 [Hyphomicrobiales bacterium BP6-180914]|uniref:Uncharacterized protein n=1 Tax=Lichenifustis flavocetrariae TaxID=2949735 RepID=A0AA42CMA5_9HYPH|nr:hypothetical protein [Lichenifustis flavocetrariae]MCW6508192.1 hypothetical protein [Lichenifustis flavocetrariae]